MQEYEVSIRTKETVKGRRGSWEARERNVLKKLDHSQYASGSLDFKLHKVVLPDLLGTIG
jgi:hypothetical protein